MGASLTVLASIVLSLLGIYLVKRFAVARPSAPHPPGPPGLPVIGNVHQYPKAAAWKTFDEWAHEYGELVMVNLLGQRMLIINSGKVAVDLLDKKSSIYSDRAVVPMCGELGGWNRALAFIQYGGLWRDLRRLLHGVISGKSNMANLATIEELETRRYLLRVLNNEGATLAEDLRKLSGAVILKISYGYQVLDDAEMDPYVSLIETALQDVVRASAPGKYLVDVLPILRHLPDWFPGAGFKRDAYEIKRNLDAALDMPFDYVKKEINTGDCAASLCSKHIGEGMDEEMVKLAAFQIYGGGADTTVYSEHFFYLAMTLHPDVQAHAQAEIDRVVGPNRLPTLADRAQLPYVDAIVKEVFRWIPVAPQGLPHKLKEDDIHDGYFIPKGTLCLANIWRFAHDPDTYRNPNGFDPTRFIATPDKPAEKDPREFVFGFGRRICPGQQLADSSVFVAVAMALAVFDISAPRDTLGEDIMPSIEYSSGILIHPLPFRCVIKARNDHAEALVRAVKDTK